MSSLRLSAGCAAWSPNGNIRRILEVRKYTYNNILRLCWHHLSSSETLAECQSYWYRTRSRPNQTGSKKKQTNQKQVITSSSQKEREKKALARRRKNPMLQVEDEMDPRYRPADKSIEEESDFDDEFDYHDIKEEKKQEELHSSDRAGHNANEFGAFDFSSPDEIQESKWLVDFPNSCTEEELAGIIATKCVAKFSCTTIPQQRHQA
jgi:hypothetical protein